MANNNLTGACSLAHVRQPGNCSGAVRLIAKEMGFSLPELSADGLVDYLDNPKNAWTTVSETEAQTAADRNRLVIAGKKAIPNGHVVVVMPGGKVPSGGYSYKDKMGKVQKAANHGSYPRACSTSQGSWPGGISKGDKSVFDSWGSLEGYKGVKYWLAPLQADFNFATLTPGKELANRLPLLKTRQWKFADLSRLTFDVPVETIFVVGGVHLVEKWFEVQARNLVGLKLRISAEEGAQLFKHKT